MLEKELEFKNLINEVMKQQKREEDLLKVLGTSLKSTFQKSINA